MNCTKSKYHHKNMDSAGKPLTFSIVSTLKFIAKLSKVVRYKVTSSLTGELMMGWRRRRNDIFRFILHTLALELLNSSKLQQHFTKFAYNKQKKITMETQLTDGDTCEIRESASNLPGSDRIKGKIQKVVSHLQTLYVRR